MTDLPNLSSFGHYRELVVPKPKLSIFCTHYLKIINTFFLKNNINHPKANCLRNSKDDNKILVGEVAFELLIKTCKILFWSITREPLGLLKFQCHFWVSHTICFRMITLFVKSVDNFEIAHKTCSILVQFPHKAKKKKLLYWRNPTDPKIRPDPTFFFLNQKKKKKKKWPTDPTKSKTCDFFFKHLILALKMLIWGFETWLVA